MHKSTSLSLWDKRLPPHIVSFSCLLLGSMVQNAQAAAPANIYMKPISPEGMEDIEADLKAEKMDQLLTRMRQMQFTEEDIDLLMAQGSSKEEEARNSILKRVYSVGFAHHENCQKLMDGERYDEATNACILSGHMHPSNPINTYAMSHLLSLTGNEAASFTVLNHALACVENQRVDAGGDPEITKILRIPTVILLGAITGAMTSGASLSVVTGAAKSDVPALGYAGTYAFANVLLTIAGTIIVALA